MPAWNPATYTPHYVPPPRKEKRFTMNDNDRREWALSDEGLWNMQRSSGKAMKAWVRENRALIDEVVNNIRNGTKKEHYLAYG